MMTPDAFPILSRFPARHPDKLQLFSVPTPNGVKVSIMLEELGVAYEAHRIPFGEEGTGSAEFRSLSRNGKIPAILDPDGPGGKTIPLFESGAILLYLADKYGRFISDDPETRWETIQWLFWQMGGVGPMFGQAHYFYRLEEKVPYAIERFYKEAVRLYNVLNTQLASSEFLAGAYSIADIATYPWVWRHDGHHVKLEEFPNVKRWYDKISERPAVKRGMEIPKK